jgi:UDP-N-acetylglucosamine--N-acetylmuramyl-(pentapeptide) pyrophosphoryl-undecaprenol N-acetylglucosamine transferase
MASPRTILFAGGGTGGHIFPSLAILERLREKHAPAEPQFLVSFRPLDAQILGKRQVPYTALPAQPLSVRPWRWPAFLRAWRASVSAVAAIIRERQAAAVVAMGGFVSAPAVAAASRAGVPVLLVNLDAVPGRANRLMARRATQVFSAYATPALRAAETIGVPLPRAAVGPRDKGEARRQLGLDPDKETLLITGGSQGAQSVNRTMLEMVARSEPRKALGRNWQVLHLTGGSPEELDAARRAYERAGIPARAETFCNQMGLAWSAASIAICRAGASTVAEAWANATPAIFMPYPYHRDQHQRLNAEPLAGIGAALLFTDQIDAKLNAKHLAGPLLALMSNAQQRIHMAELMRDRRPPDGAQILAERLTRLLG